MNIETGALSGAMREAILITLGLVVVACVREGGSVRAGDETGERGTGTGQQTIRGSETAEQRKPEVSGEGVSEAKGGSAATLEAVSGRDAGVVADAGSEDRTVGEARYRKVTGTVAKYCAYGPPNYGESPKSDAKEPLALLILDEPIERLEVEDVGISREVRDIRMMQMASFGSSGAPSPASLVGQHVTLSVEDLAIAVTGHHHTRVLAWFDGVTEARWAAGFSLWKIWPQVAHDFKGTPCAGYPR